jgi:hypothetical protein
MKDNLSDLTNVTEEQNPKDADPSWRTAVFTGLDEKPLEFIDKNVKAFEEDDTIPVQGESGFDAAPEELPAVTSEMSEPQEDPQVGEVASNPQEEVDLQESTQEQPQEDPQVEEAAPDPQEEVELQEAPQVQPQESPQVEEPPELDPLQIDDQVADKMDPIELNAPEDAIFDEPEPQESPVAQDQPEPAPEVREQEPLENQEEPPLEAPPLMEYEALEPDTSQYTRYSGPAEPSVPQMDQPEETVFGNSREMRDLPDTGGFGQEMAPMFNVNVSLGGGEDEFVRQLTEQLTPQLQQQQWIIQEITKQHFESNNTLLLMMGDD